MWETILDTIWFVLNHIYAMLELNFGVGCLFAWFYFYWTERSIQSNPR